VCCTFVTITGGFLCSKKTCKGLRDGSTLGPGQLIPQTSVLPPKGDNETLFDEFKVSAYIAAKKKRCDLQYRPTLKCVSPMGAHDAPRARPPLVGWEGTPIPIPIYPTRRLCVSILQPSALATGHLHWGRGGEGRGHFPKICSCETSPGCILPNA